MTGPPGAVDGPSRRQTSRCDNQESSEPRPLMNQPAFGAILDPATLGRSDTLITTNPFAFLIARGQLPDQVRAELAADFPRYRGAGFFPHDPADCGPSINRLVEELSAGDFADAIGSRLGIPDLGRYPSLVTICRSLNRRHGNVHTDSRSKVVTALLYLMDDWPADEHGGCLRFLREQDDIDSLVGPEIRPVYGNLAAFRRADNSWHGHLPFEGERRVIQVAWVTSADEKARKTRRGRLSRFVKWMAGGLDRAWGRGRRQ